MDTANKKRLGEILSNFDRIQEEQNESSASNEQKQEKFLDAFNECATIKITPIMEEIGELLKNHGHDFSIKYQKEYVDFEGKLFAPRITMKLYPLSEKPDAFTELAYFVAFQANKESFEIEVHENNIETKNNYTTYIKEQKYTFKSLTNERISKEIIDTVEKILISETE
jgi:hypothetical protein